MLTENRPAYIEEHTLLSFLNFLRHTSRPLVGATAFTDIGRQSDIPAIAREGDLVDG